MPSPPDTMHGALRDRVLPAPAPPVVAERRRGIPALTAYRACWIVLSVAAAAPLFLVRYPPMYDYHLWVFQGRIVSDLLLQRPDSGGAVADLYAIRHVPVPNSAAPVVLGLLSAWLSPEQAAHAFAAICVLAFAYGFAFLVRSVQRRPTALEFLGLPFASGYFLYKGYVSYLLTLALAFATIGLLHRIWLDRDGRPKRRDIALLTAFGVLIFLGHLIAWLVLAFALAVYALSFVRQQRRDAAAALVATTLPALAMLIVYAVARTETASGQTALYAHALLSHDKLISLAEPLMLFLRPDPFAPVVPTFWLNVGGWLLLAVPAAAAVRSLRGGARPLLLLSGILAAIALVLPFYSAVHLLRPDERLVLPAVLLFAAALPLRELTLPRLSAAAAAVLLIAGAHALEDHHAGVLSDRIEAVSEAVIPPDAQVLSLTVFAGPVHGGCGSSSFESLSIGAPTLRWLGVYRLMHTGTISADIEDTSLVRVKSGQAHKLTVEAMTREQIAREGVVADVDRGGYAYVELFGCADDIDFVREQLRPGFAAISSGEGYVILRRQR